MFSSLRRANPVVIRLEVTVSDMTDQTNGGEQPVSPSTATVTVTGQAICPESRFFINKTSTNQAKLLVTSHGYYVAEGQSSELRSVCVCICLRRVFSRQMPGSQCREKILKKSRLEPCDTDSPGQLEALRSIDSAKSPSPCICMCIQSEEKERNKNILHAWRRRFCWCTCVDAIISMLWKLGCTQRKLSWYIDGPRIFPPTSAVHKLVDHTLFMICYKPLPLFDHRYMWPASQQN